MNAKKCKALRRMLRQDAAALAAEGKTLPANGIVYKDTRRVVGYDFPVGWIKAAWVRLMLAGGPWKAEALAQAKPRFARQALNVPGSFRQVYRRVKRVAQAVR